MKNYDIIMNIMNVVSMIYSTAPVLGTFSVANT